MSFGADAPAQWSLLADSERANSELGQEQCFIASDGKRHYFVRACLNIPIRGTDKTFTWGVWVSLSEENMREVAQHWEDSERTSLGAYSGWLCTKIPEYPDTMFLKTKVHQQPVGIRPIVELEATDHPLAIHQREGIEPDQLRQIVAKVMHSQS